MPAQTYNLLIEQGSRFQRELQIKVNGAVKDLTGFTARAQIRRKHGDATAIATFTVEIDPITHKIRWMLTSAQSEALPPTCKSWEVPKNFQTKPYPSLPTGSFVWDLELVDPTGEVLRILQGAVLITPEATK